MDNKTTQLEQQVKFSKTNTLIAYAMSIFYFMLACFGINLRLSTYISGSIVILMLIIDGIIARKKHYFESTLFIMFSRIVVSFMISISMIDNHNYRFTATPKDNKLLLSMEMVFIGMCICYTIINLELMMLFDITEPYYRINALLVCVSPLLFVMTIEYIINENLSSYDILTVLGLSFFVGTMFFAVIKSLGEMLSDFYEAIFKHERIAINSKEEADNLKLYQSKLVRANEQLSKQKLLLEKANTTISRSNTEMKLQYMLVKQINSELDSHKIMNFITDGIQEHLKVDLCAVIINRQGNEDDPEELLLSANCTSDSNLGDDIVSTLRKSEFIKFYSYLPNATYVADNRVPDGKYDFLIGSNIGSLLIYPMVVQDKTSGVLIVGKNSYGYFKDNISFYETIVEQIILALRNAFMYAKVQDMATKDALTTIYNRRYFNSIYPEYSGRAVASSTDLTVVLFDIDRFKLINDNYGHIFGDKVIKYCGRLAGEYAKRHNGIAVRYGGEEFVICFLDKKIEEVNKIIKEFHEELKHHEFDFEDKKININVSIGITSYPDICSNISDLLNRADLTMYESKQNGRGRITIDSGH